MYTVLVIEDEIELLKTLKLMLEMNNFKVLAAPNGSVGISYLANDGIGLIISDINLPDCTGHDILRYVRENDHTKDLPFIFLTAYSDDANLEEAKGRGASDYIIKPFSSKALIKTVTDLMKKQ